MSAAPQPETRAQVVIGTLENGRPSIKVNGEELAYLIGESVSLEWVPGDYPYWSLKVEFLEPRVEANVEAEVSGQ